MKKLVYLLMIFCCSIPVSANPHIEYKNGVYHITLDDINKTTKHIDFVSVEELETNFNVHKAYKSKLTVNTGFFDPNNKKTISYIESKDEGSENPLFNEALVTNPILSKNLGKILNRTEFRVLECEDNIYQYEITAHNNPVPVGCSILTSAQGGPELYPNLKLEEEFFIVKDSAGNIIRESCSVLHKTARTIFAIKDNSIIILIFTNKAPVTLLEAQEYLKNLNIDKAMAFDGGSSTSLDYKDEIHVVSTQNDGNDTGRKLKSFMIYK